MAARIKTIIVEDEEYDKMLIEKVLTENYSSEIEVVSSVGSKELAIEAINKHKPQLVFFDIELNGIRDGAFHVLEEVEHNFKVIFVTGKSHQDDFIKAIRLSCIDYLIKPTKISDFESPVKRAINEIKNEVKQQNNQLDIFKHNIQTQNSQEAKISLQNGYSYFPANIKDIIRCEAEGNYCKFYFTDNKSMLINGNLKQHENKMTGFCFCRLNKSEMVNMMHLKSFSRRNENWEVKMDDDKVVNISASRKQNFKMLYDELF